jgi:hypothetical protein
MAIGPMIMLCLYFVGGAAILAALFVFASNILLELSDRNGRGRDQPLAVPEPRCRAKGISYKISYSMPVTTILHSFGGLSCCHLTNTPHLFNIALLAVDIRKAGNLQHGPGLAVHWLGVHQPTRHQQHRHQHGRQMGLWRDTVFVKRLWHSQVRGDAYQSVNEARNSIRRYLDFYNGRRPHWSLDGSTPDQAYINLPAFRKGA